MIGAYELDLLSKLLFKVQCDLTVTVEVTRVNHVQQANFTASLAHIKPSTTVGPGHLTFALCRLTQVHSSSDSATHA